MKIIVRSKNGEERVRMSEWEVVEDELKKDFEWRKNRMYCLVDLKDEEIKKDRIEYNEKFDEEVKSVKDCERLRDEYKEKREDKSFKIRESYKESVINGEMGLSLKVRVSRNRIFFRDRKEVEIGREIVVKSLENDKWLYNRDGGEKEVKEKNVCKRIELKGSEWKVSIMKKYYGMRRYSSSYDVGSDMNGKMVLVKK
jgi:hypothetical protein